MSYLLSVDWEAVQSLTVSVLKEDLVSLQKDLLRAENADRGFAFSLDRDEDIEHIKRHIDAYQLLIKYYGGKP
jgi:hypothetical protein